MSISIGKSVLSKAELDFLEHIDFDLDLKTATFNGSFISKPSSFSMGTLKMSSGVQAVSYTLADGTRAIGLVNRYNDVDGSISNPSFFALDKAQGLNVNDVFNYEFEGDIVANYTTVGDNLTYDFQVCAAETGILRVQYWAGTQEDGTLIFDQVRRVTQEEVDAGGFIWFERGNPYLLKKGVPLTAKFSGIKLRGNQATGLPFFRSIIMPYKEITLNGHTINVYADLDVWVGCDYAPYFSTATNEVIRLKVRGNFKNNFKVKDPLDAFSNNKYVIVDFNDFGQGLVYLKRKGEYIEFHYKGDAINGSAGWYAKDLKAMSSDTGASNESSYTRRV